MTTLTEQDIQRNLRAVAHAIAQQELEGLTVTPATVADLHRAARGEIDTDQIIRNIYRRLQNVPLLRQ
jgi:Antitoxin VbhA